MSLLIASILPVVILMVYFYYHDKYEKEPLKSLTKAFFGGILSVLLTLLLVSFFSIPVPENASQTYIAFVQSFGQAGIPEEISKFVILYFFIWRDKNFNEYYDGILYAVFVSLGFACVENIVYVMQYGMNVAISRALLAVPLHALCGVIMGYYFSLAKFTNQKNSNLLKAVIFAILVHGFYDFILFFLAPYVEILPFVGILSTVLVFVFVGYMWKISLAKIRFHVSNSVFKDRKPCELI